MRRRPIQSAVASRPVRHDAPGMSLKVNLRHLDKGAVVLDDDIPGTELAPDFQDELIRLVHPVEYELKVEKQPGGLLITGTLSTRLECECARCLKLFVETMSLPEFTALAPFEGEDAIPVEGDFADLTPIVREDILLALPTTPLCRPDCRGLTPKSDARDFHLRKQPEPDSAWSALDKLKL